MKPITLEATQTLAGLLSANDAYNMALQSLALGSRIAIPPVAASQVVLTSAAPAMGDEDVQLTYPRICLYSAGLKNTQDEMFMSVSGTLTLTADVWASANLVTQVEQWLHFYLEAFTTVLRQNRGDWGSGLFFGGNYDVAFQPPKPGGLGFVQLAKVSIPMFVSQG